MKSGLKKVFGFSLIFSFLIGFSSWVGKVMNKVADNLSARGDEVNVVIHNQKNSTTITTTTKYYVPVTSSVCVIN